MADQDLDSLPTRPGRLERFRNWIKKDARPTDWAIVILTAGLLTTSILQWKVISDGSTDTHALAVSAQRQAANTEQLAKAAVTQVELMRKQLNGTEAAFLDVQPQLDANTGTITVWVYNNGRVTARAVRISVRVTLQSIPNQRTVGSGTSLDYLIPVLSGLVNTGARYGDSRTFQIPHILGRWADVVALKAFIQADLNYSYDNGFGDIIRADSCFAWLGHGTAAQPPARMPCDQVPVNVRALLRELRP